MSVLTRDDRIRGSMLASAVGDALGADIEFLSTATIRERFGPDGTTGYVGPAGEITDDTQMLLFTAEGLIRGVNRVIDRSAWGDVVAPVEVDEPALYEAPDPMHHAYLRWLHTQGGRPPRPDEPAWLLSGWLVGRRELHRRRAPGNTCLSALESGRYGTVDEPINTSKGCGGVMRVAPIGLVAGERSFRLAADAAAITHGHPSGWLAAGALARILDRLVAGDHLTSAIDACRAELARWPHHEETSTAIDAAVRLAERAPSATPEAIETLGGGWIAEEALAISLYCALVGDELRSALLASVNHSGDSDSTGAVTGAIVGAITGPSAIPVEWIEGLAEREVVETVTADLLAHVPAGAGTVAFDVERYPPN